MAEAVEEGQPVAAVDQTAPEPSLSGRFSVNYVGRLADDADVGDEDVYVGLQLDYGSSSDRYSGSLYYRGVRDVNGDMGGANTILRSPYDEEGGWFHQLFYAYADIRTDGPVRHARLGRQLLYAGQPFHFDGAKVVSKEGPLGMRASVFGGVPVHFFEESSDGDSLVGVSAEMRPWLGGQVRALYAQVESETSFGGLPATTEEDDLVILSVGSRLGDWGSALVRYTSVNSDTRDIIVRGQASSVRLDADISVSYYTQPDALDELTLDLSPFNLVEGVSQPYSKLDLSIGKGFAIKGGWTTRVEARGALRRLDDEGDEGVYNREYDFLWLGLTFEAPKEERFSASIGQAWWTSSSDDMRALEAEVRWQPTDEIKLSVGTSFALYRYDVLSLEEETDVRETYVRARWKPVERTEIHAKYAAESFEDERVHTLELGWAINF